MLLAASLLLAVTAGCGDDPAPQPAETKPGTKKATTPGTKTTTKQAAATKSIEELWGKFRQGVVDKQWDVVYNSLNNESRKLLLGSMLIGAHRLSAAEPTRQQSFQQLLSAHSIGPEKFQTPKPLLEMRGDELTPLAKELGAGVTDGARCFNDVMTWLATNVPNAADYRFLNADEWNRTNLNTIRVNGTQATGTLTTTAEDNNPEAEIRHPVAFVFELEWKLDLETSEQMASGRVRS